MSILITGGAGYIGSTLSRYFFDSKIPYQVVDTERYGDGTLLCNFRADYKTLSQKAIRTFDTIIHCAAHSSVAACEDEPLESLKNNCIGFIDLVQKLSKKQKFIYISSGSVYGKSGNRLVEESDVLSPPIGEYDRQKQFNDYFIENKNLNWFGLRLGTVNGHSTNPRNRLMINSMTRSALLNNRVAVRNGDSYRAILGLPDLCRAIHFIVEKDGVPGYYNLASFNSQIKEIGYKVASIFKSNYDESGGEDRYSFCLDTTKFQRNFNFVFKDTIESICLEASKNDFSKDRY